MQKKGLKIQKGGKKVAVAIAQPRREGKGRKVTPAKRSGNPRRAEPRDVPRRRDRRPGREGSGKRTVDLPRLTDLRITISNDKASPASCPSRCLIISFPVAIIIAWLRSSIRADSSHASCSSAGLQEALRLGMMALHLAHYGHNSLHLKCASSQMHLWPP